MIIALTLALGTTSAFAATLDLQTATELALTQANDAFDADLAIAQQQIAQRTARLSWTPSLSSGLGASMSLGRTFSEQLGTNVTEPIASLSGSLTSSMPLYQGGALSAARRSAAADLDAASRDQAQTRLDLQQSAIDGLLLIRQAHEALAIQQAALQADQALLAQVEVQVNGGSRTPADRYAQQAVVAARHASIAAAAQDVAVSELTLLSLLRLDASEDWTFEAPEPAPTLGEDAGALLATALQTRPAVAAADARIASAQASKRSADGAFLPSVSLGAGLSTSWLSTREDTFATQVDDQARGWGAIDVSLPLLDRGVRRSRSDAAAVGVKQAELARQRLTDALELDIRQLLAARAAAQVAVEASGVAAAAAAQAVAVLQLRYQAGAETLVAVTAARADLVDAEMSLSRAEASLQRVQVQLAWTVGQRA